MVAQNIEEIIKELDRTHGAPVQFEHPQTHARYVLIPQADYQRIRPLLEPTQPVHGDAVEWNEQKNARRCELIDQKIAGTLTQDAALELRGLQDEVLRYRQRVAPLPLEEARQLHRALLAKAASAEAQD